MLVNLDEHAVAVRDILDTSEPLGLGLWISAQTASELVRQDTRLDSLCDWFAARRLIPYTTNAFPFGEFHGVKVKHDVYEPAWWDVERAKYTLDVARVLQRLLPMGRQGTISTLPIGWAGPNVTDDHLNMAAEQLHQVALELSAIEFSTGCHLRVCLEPEPGCLLQRATDVLRFFDEQLRPRVAAELVDRHLGVCHDICHSAVMFESQSDVLEAYKRANIQVGKVQVSSAIVAKPGYGDQASEIVLGELAAFAEDRYLHQTMIRSGDEYRFFEDLPEALGQYASTQATEWRVHFHLPLFIESFGSLGTSQVEIRKCIETLRRLGLQPEFEVETYAWSVLPQELRDQPLASGIAREILWLRHLVQDQ